MSTLNLRGETNFVLEQYTKVADQKFKPSHFPTNMLCIRLELSL